MLFFCSLRDNKRTEGWCTIFKTLRNNKDNKIESWDLSEQGIDLEIVKVLADYVSVSTAVRSLKCAQAFQRPSSSSAAHDTRALFACRLCGNRLGTEGWCAIFGALRDNKDNKIESWDLQDERAGPEVAKVLAEYVSASTAVRSLKCALAL